MTAPDVNLTGLHFVHTPRGPLGSRWQVYAWRGGPRIMTADQIGKPRLTPAALAAFVKAKEAPATKPRGDTFAALADAYLSSPEYLLNSAGKERSKYTKRDYRMWADRAKSEFGTAPLRFFEKPEFRQDVIAWRDRWTHSPSQADAALSVLSVILSWGVERGRLDSDPVKLIRKKYRGALRADILWTDDEIESFASAMPRHIARAFRLIAWTGLARSDIVSLRWSEVGDLYISHPRSKTRNEQIIPLFDQSRSLIAEFREAAKSHDVRALAVVTDRWGEPLSPERFDKAVQRARKKRPGVAEGKTLHDLRGTFATRLMDAGFSDGEIDEVLGWETGRSKDIRRVYISRRSVVLSAIERMRERTERGK